MKNKRKAKRILAGLLALQLVFFVGVGTYVQNVYAEETVKSQTEEKEYPEKNDKNQVMLEKISHSLIYKWKNLCYNELNNNRTR